MPSSVVCVSKVNAAGGEAIGRRVAERLGVRCVDDEVITVAADLVVNTDALEVARSRPSSPPRRHDRLRAAVGSR